MKIGIATEGDSVAQHFGRCSAYTIVELQGTEVLEQ
ncbi:MAG: dinitrogenase iron-molybdenum cofactor, partial [Candidatus Helarchaeota archaeon]|nr:dinitrogenase iron-molybdenum cofactor [Candidatus Helarchaeota archaeon]